MYLDEFYLLALLVTVDQFHFRLAGFDGVCCI
jgi:hypothetical protein